jgi:prophage regulatory protein
MKQQRRRASQRTAPRRKDVSPLPQEGFVREPAVLGAVPFGRSTLWSKVKAGQFPKPVKLSDRITAWPVQSVRAWIEARTLQRTVA